MKLLSSESILLRRRAFQEGDWIVTFLTPHCGLLKGIVRGSRKLTSRGIGDFEPLSMGMVYYSKHPTRELVNIRKRDGVTSGWYFSQNYEKFCYASYLSELMELCPIATEQASDYYQLLNKGLKEILQATQLRLLPLVRLRFELKYLRLMGIQPNWKICMHCGTSPPWSKTARLSPSMGGILCPQCIHQTPNAPLIDPLSLAFIIAWQSGQPHQKPQKAWLEQLLNALSAYLRHHIERQPRSLALLPNLDQLANMQNSTPHKHPL